jgi:hypothetical protein
MRRTVAAIAIAIMGVVVSLLAAGALARPCEMLNSTPPDLTRVVVHRVSTFGAVDVFIDAGDHSLGAYQVEIVPSPGVRAKLVGIEGGADGSFGTPPSYDPAALHRTAGFDRVILAAFSTDDRAPTGRVRVARLHFQFGAGMTEFEVRLIAAGDAQARPIAATASVIPVHPDQLDREGAPR